MGIVKSSRIDLLLFLRKRDHPGIYEMYMEFKKDAIEVDELERSIESMKKKYMYGIILYDKIFTDQDFFLEL